LNVFVDEEEPKEEEAKEELIETEEIATSLFTKYLNDN